MKTAVKVFLILSIISGIICGLFCLFLIGVASSRYFSEYLGEYFEEYFIIDFSLFILGIFGIFVVALVIVSLIVSIIALNKVNTAKRASDISTGFKILVLLFSNIISGILLLCMNDDDFSPSYSIPSYSMPYTEKNKANDMDELVKLKKLLDMGAITPEEYEAKKKQILNL